MKEIEVEIAEPKEMVAPEGDSKPCPSPVYLLGRKCAEAKSDEK